MTATMKRTNSDEKPIRVVIYVRVSSKNQDIENSAEAQIAECKAYIKKMGWVLVGIYVDKAESGRNDKRPQHSLMVYDGTRPNPEFDRILVWKMDRYARDETHSSLTKAMLRKNGVDVFSIKDPNAEGKFGRVTEVLVDTMAEIYSEGISENVKRGTRHLAKQGYYLGAEAPYGYRIEKVQVGEKYHQKLVIDPETSRVARSIFDNCLAGKSIGYILRDLYARGIPSPSGLPKWSSTTISAMLHNRHYAGTIVWSANTDDEDGSVICPDAHPGIVTQEEHDKVQRLLADRQYKTKEPNKGKNPRELGSSYLLSGIISCQLCGSKMQPKPAKSGTYAYYGCSTRADFSKSVCDCPNQRSTRLEPTVMAKIREDILGDANINQIIEQVRADTNRFNVDYADKMAELDKKLEQISRRQDRALQAFEMDTIARDKYLERMNALDEDRQRLEQEKADAEAIAGEEAIILTSPKSVIDHATQIREFLETLEPREWKPIIHSFVKNISIGHTTGVITYKIPLPDDDPFSRRMTSTIDLSGKVLSSVQSGPSWVAPPTRG